MLLDAVVTASAQVAATTSRTAKRAALATVLRQAAQNPDDVEPVAAMLAGAPRQGRVGAGWATMLSLDVAPAAAPSLTVAELDAALTELAATSGQGATARRRERLAGVLARATDAEQHFIARLLLGELRQGALESLVLDAVAEAASLPPADVRTAAMLAGSAAEVARLALTGGAGALVAVRLSVGRPVSPMLASPAASLDAALAGLGETRVEYKMDGARIQVHREGEDVAVFTRTLRDITASVPELVALVRELPCRSAVLDGETLALDDAGRPRPFQETMSRFGATTARAALLHPFFFDVLHLDGEDLLARPLSERSAALGALVGPLRMPGIDRPEPTTAGAHLQAALDAGHEGVVVKAMDSAYAAGRRGKAWQKVKPVHTLDLLVLAAEWGYGRRTGWLSNLHLGARDPTGGPPVMVGKTFKGLTDAVLTWQTEALQAIERERSRGTVFVRPELVVEIALDGAQTSSRYPGGVALRFARVVRYRPDKGPDDADTIDAVRAMLPAGLP